MKIVFFGTPNYVLPVLETVANRFRTKGKRAVIAVVTQGPKPVGRKKQLAFSAVDHWAKKRGVKTYHRAVDLVEDGIKADLGVLASYGEIIPKKVIDHFPNGILNIHPSLLPKWRGASPVQAAIVSGERETGVTIIKLDEGLDSGPVVSSFKEAILPKDTTQSLRARLFEKSVPFLASLIPKYLEKKVNLKPQQHAQARITRQLTKNRAMIPPQYLNNALIGQPTNLKWRIEFIKDLEMSPNPKLIERFVRAMNPWPVAWTTINLKDVTKRLKIVTSHLDEGRLVPDIVQLEGKNPVAWRQFQEGYKTATFA